MRNITILIHSAKTRFPFFIIYFIYTLYTISTQTRPACADNNSSLINRHVFIFFTSLCRVAKDVPFRFVHGIKLIF